MKYDVGIIGGGLAGLSTALHICSVVDATILIIDRKKIGDHTKSSPFTFPDVVKKYGLHDAIVQRYTKFTYRSPQGASATFRYKEPAFVTLDYEKACKVLLMRIKNEGNVELLENTKVLGFETKKSFWRAHNITLKISEHENATVNILVDASGKAFFSARHLGIRLPPFYSHAYGEVLTGCEVEDPEEMHIIAGRKYGNGGGWFYPIGNKTARFGFAMVTRSVNYPYADVRANTLRARKDFYPYNGMVKDATPMRAEFGTIPIGPFKRFVFDRIMIVGDAAAQATPWYCEGIRPALESGEMCGKAIAKAYKQKCYPRRILNEYQRKWDSRYRHFYSRAMVRVAYSWFMSQNEWDNAVRKASLLSSRQMLTEIRYGQHTYNRYFFSLPFFVYSFLSTFGIRRLYNKTKRIQNFAD